ncbi:MAG: hypothetical protein RI952_1247 [Bacteroidota bacterium]|jgi:hypothetical protein
MKKGIIAYWVCTIIIFLMEGVMPALTSQTEMAKQGISHLGYPTYFGNILVIFKVLGALALLLPIVPAKIKEWAYAGFTFNLIFAFLSHGMVDGFTGLTYFPLVIMVILWTSYLQYHKIFIQKNSAL